MLRKEIATLCSNLVPSVVRDKSNDGLKSFQWKCLLDELQTHAPMLLEILKSCTKVRRPISQQQAVIGVITAILCKNRRNSASLIQRLISVILYSGCIPDGKYITNVESEGLADAKHQHFDVSESCMVVACPLPAFCRSIDSIHQCCFGL